MDNDKDLEGFVNFLNAMKEANERNEEKKQNDPTYGLATLTRQLFENLVFVGFNRDEAFTLTRDIIGGAGNRMHM